jgi:hypothetical protein
VVLKQERTAGRDQLCPVPEFSRVARPPRVSCKGGSAGKGGTQPRPAGPLGVPIDWA